jgi:AraC-like DNA-binding protein/ligand-binding sensor protein
MTSSIASGEALRPDDERVLSGSIEAARQYAEATGVRCIVLDSKGAVLQAPQGPEPCAVCAIRRGPGSGDEANTVPCSVLHLDAARQACRFGGFFVYLCSVGFMHWVSPLFSGGRSVGALVGGPVLAIDRDEAIASIRDASPELDKTAAALCADVVPLASAGRVQALAQVLATLAERASAELPGGFDRTRRITEQQSRISEEIHEMKRCLPADGAIPGYPLEKERALLDALRRGDESGSRRTLNELLGSVFFSSGSNFELIKFRAVELLVLLSRAVIESGNADAELLDADFRNLQRIQESADQEELADRLNVIVAHFSRRAFSFRAVKHSMALRKAERYIREHFLENPPLHEVASAAGLSPAYFSTVFKEELGESFSDFLSRLKVEKAAELLLGSELSLADVADTCGFQDQSWFSRVFKRHMGVSPGRFREAGGRRSPELKEIHE